MALSTRPKRLADEVRERLTFTLRTNVDEHTLKRYQLSLERLRAESKMEPEDYVALGRVYFNQKDYHKFFEIMDEGLRLAQDLDIRTNAIIGKMMLWNNKLLDQPHFDFYIEWFDPTKNPDKQPLSFQFYNDHWLYAGKRYDFQKAVIGNIQIEADGVCRIEVGPLLAMESYQHFRDENCDFFNHAFSLFLEHVTLGMASQEELRYFLDIMGKEHLEEVTQKAATAMKKKDVVLNEIVGLAYPLRKDIAVTITVEDGHVLASNADLDISISGATIDEAIEEFKEFFAEDSRFWVEASPDNLSDDARVLKDRFLKYIQV